MSLDFYTEKGVLIPRADTETLVETVLEKIPDGARVIDICSGSGCIGISLAHYKKNISAVLLDISDSAIELSRKNTQRHGLSDRVKTVKADILNEIPDGKYDVLVSNPPYIESGIIPTLMKEVRDYEPQLALDG